MKSLIVIFGLTAASTAMASVDLGIEIRGRDEGQVSATWVDSSLVSIGGVFDTARRVGFMVGNDIPIVENLAVRSTVAFAWKRKEELSCTAGTALIVTNGIGYHGPAAHVRLADDATLFAGYQVGVRF